ncbi:MAG: RNA methyltransferase [Bacteroidetes bacterium]|nr:RNA methyltransferase [Bacteroidota bacterium]
MGLPVSEIKYVQSLRIKKFRQRYHQFIVEGDKSVAELLHSDWQVMQCYHTDAFVPKGNAVQFIRVNEKEMERLSHHQSPQNALAVVSMQAGIEKIPDSGIQLYLDGIRDPGNLGTILRIADWYGIKNVWCSEDSVDVYNPKSIDASMGSFIRVKLHVHEGRDFLHQCSLPSYAAVMDGENIHQMKLPEDAVILVGNEGKGIRPELMTAAQYSVSIPRFGEAESLNAGVAAALLLDNFFRGL